MSKVSTIVLLPKFTDQEQYKRNALTVFRETQTSLESGSLDWKILKANKMQSWSAFVGWKHSQIQHRIRMILNHAHVLSDKAGLTSVFSGQNQKQQIPSVYILGSLHRQIEVDNAATTPALIHLAL